MKRSKTPKSASKPHSITIRLTDRAYALLLGVAGYDNYAVNQLDKMVLRSVVGLVESTYEGGAGFEKEVHKIFGVEMKRGAVVEAIERDG
jgi:hypothetical protein